MPLTDTACRQAKGRDKPYKLTDGGGLYLHVMPDGRKYWRMAYRFDGRQKTLAIGVYPAISLADARRTQAEAKATLASGQDPSATKQQAKAKVGRPEVITVADIARDWFDKQTVKWSDGHALRLKGRLEQDIYPTIGRLPVASVTPADVIEAIRKIENRGAIDTSRRVKQMVSQIFSYAISCGLTDRNPADHIGAALTARPRQVNHHALPISELPEFLHKLEAYDGHLQTRLALWMILLTFVRTTELRGALWDEVDFKDALWRIPASRMKMHRDHLVPLSRQAVAALETLRAMAAGSPFIYPSPAAGKVMSSNTMIYALYRMGYHSRATTHGFRAMASTWLNENGYHPDWIETQLAHAPKNEVRAAYNRASYLDQRRRMMQDWADFLDSQRPGPAS